MKAGNAVAALKKSLKPTAEVFRDGGWKSIDAALVVPGDKVKLASGSAVPADCTINEGTVDIDEAALTGESLPVTMLSGTNHLVKMGSTVVRGEVDGTVRFTGKRTFFGKTAEMISSVGSEMGNIKKVLIRVMFVLTTLSAVLCLTSFGYLMVYVKLDFTDALQFAVVLLIVSIPIAIEIVVTTTLALGSKILSKKKVIVTQLASIEMMAAVNILCSDKTGTLTQNKMEIQQECPTFRPGYDIESVLVLAALAAKWRELPRDALDKMILGAANLEECDKYEQLQYVPFDPRTKRTEATLRNKATGEVFKVMKGALNVIMDLIPEKDGLHHKVEEMEIALSKRGIRSMAVARTFDTDHYELVGILTFLDPPRPDAAETIKNSRKFGVPVKMITGDNILIAAEMAKMIGLNTNILPPTNLPKYPESGNAKDVPKTLGDEYGDRILAADGFARVFPEHKFLIVETLRQKGYTVAMTGDGVNDAPALKRADVGVAVFGATDAARAASAIVLTQPGLHVICDAFIIARGVFQRMVAFLMYRVAATLQLILFFFIAVFALPPSKYQPSDTSDEWPSYFHLPVLLFMLITLLNDGTLLTIGYDRTFPAPRPLRWNLRVLFLISSLLGGVACLSSLLLLWMTLDSHRQGSVFNKIGLNPMDYGAIISAIYLKISISDFLTLFSARTLGKFFFMHRPAAILIIGGCCALAISTVLATCWPTGTLDKIEIAGLAWGNNRLMPLWVWLYCIVWWFIQDAVKVLAYYLINKFDVFSYRTMLDPKVIKGRSEQSSPQHSPL